MAWELTRIRWEERQQLAEHLRDGWEPFAVTDGFDEEAIWLRRETTSQYAGVEPPRQRSEWDAVSEAVSSRRPPHDT